MRNSLEQMQVPSPGRSASTMGRIVVVVLGAAIVAAGSGGTASADERSGSGYFWADERVDHHVAMDDPWMFRGPTNYRVATQPSCWMYSARQELVAEVSVSAPDRYEPFPFDSDRLFFPVRETVTVDWVNTATGQQGQAVVRGESGAVQVGVPAGPGRIELDIHLRSDHPWLHAAGSTDLPFGHSDGLVHAVVDLAGKSCG